MIEFHLDDRTGISPYMQLVRQVRQSLRLGLLREGDQLPTVKEVVARLAINPNTVLKAYRELERAGLVEPRPGLGTFVLQSLARPESEADARLRVELEQWVERAAGAGLDKEDVDALFGDVRDTHFRRETVRG
jgi:GntR family transcriptional regulator